MHALDFKIVVSSLMTCFISASAARSKVKVSVGRVRVCCYEASHRRVASTTVYLKWHLDSMDGHPRGHGIPLAFIVQIRAKINDHQTPWTSFVVRLCRHITCVCVYKYRKLRSMINRQLYLFCNLRNKIALIK